MAKFLIVLSLALLCNAEVIQVPIKNLSPESISYSHLVGKFFLGSLNMGTVHSVSRSGKVEEVISSPPLSSTAGVLTVDQWDLLLVCNSNVSLLQAWVTGQPEFSGFQTSLVFANLTTGEFIKEVDMSEVGPAKFRLCNDIAVNVNTGDIWVTDSLGAQIIKTDVGGAAPVSWLYNADWLAYKPTRGFGLDGIAYNPICDCLIATELQHNMLWNIPAQNPKQFEMVKLTNIEAIGNPDGARFSDDFFSYFVVNNGANLIYQFTSDEQWKELHLVTMLPTRFANPTAVTFSANQVWASSAYLFQNHSSYPIYTVPVPPYC